MRATQLTLRAVVLAALVLPVVSQAAAAAETRVYQVTLKGQPVGRTRLTVREEPGGILVYTHQSRLLSRRGGRQVARTLIEEARVKDGAFLSGWAVREAGGERRVVTAEWDPTRRAVKVHIGPEVSWVPLPDGRAPAVLFEAGKRLADAAQVGVRRNVFDVAEARVGTVALLEPPNADGWFEVEELGVRVARRYAPRGRLPDEIRVPALTLVWKAEQIALGDSAKRPRDVTGGGVPVSGRFAPGTRVQLLPKEAWPGVHCPPEGAELTAAGAICPVDPTDPTLAPHPPQPGPRLRALAKEVPDGPPLERARFLARAIARRLSAEPGEAGLWEADPELALARGAGDCNEAAAIFMAVARLIDLPARRRTGLVMTSDDRGHMWPHAWVEIHDGERWIRVDPSRGQAPAPGPYLDLGDGEELAARTRTLAPVLRGGRIQIVGTPKEVPKARQARTGPGEATPP
ncbi:MAG: transglutaminase domain-containing protein [Deltaproteobacteria bacterium]|nr:MAG: transglutaminase domain-containing protein [Deltaproteobacteria bacterium]